MLAVTEVGNAHFVLIEESKMAEFRKRCLAFDVQPAADHLKRFSSSSTIGHTS
jgi:hypothetical protein